MAVNAHYRLINIGHILENSRNEAAELIRDSVAHGIRDIYRRGAGINNCLQDLIEVCRLGAAGIQRRELKLINVFVCHG